MPLFFRCKNCNGEHISPILFSDRSSYERTRLTSNLFQCPYTRNHARYRKEDLYWKVDIAMGAISMPADSTVSVRGTDLSTARILAVDDEQAVLTLLEQLLQRAGYVHVVTTTQAADCLDLYDSFQPDLVLLDLQMPDCSGHTVLERLRGRVGASDYMPVLIISGDLEPDSKRRALAGGAKDFIHKPFDQMEVLLRIRNLLETRLLHQRLQKYTAMLEAQLRVTAPQEQLEAAAGS